MHIAFSLLTLDPGHVGGSETYARGLLAAFGAGDGADRLTVMAGPGAVAGLAPLARGPVTVVAVPGLRVGGGRAQRFSGLVGGMLRPPAHARELAASTDVLHHPLTVPVPRPPGASVLTLFDVLHHDVPALFSRSERAFRRFAYDGPARRATRVVTVSEHARLRIVATLGVAPEHVVAIQPGIDHARFRPAGDDAAALEGLPLPTPPWLLYPAALWPHKNHRALLEALARCPAELSLALTGADLGRAAELRATAERLRVGARVRQLGYVEADALPALYRRATGVVFPSLAEGFGQPVVEAMACGCPVAASDAGAVAEACGGAALQFPPRDVAAMATAMTRLAHDEGLRQELRGAGIERARALTWERSAQRHSEVYAAARSDATRP